MQEQEEKLQLTYNVDQILADLDKYTPDIEGIEERKKFRNVLDKFTPQLAKDYINNNVDIPDDLAFAMLNELRQASALQSMNLTNNFIVMLGLSTETCKFINAIKSSPSSIDSILLL